jgi:hypothetical protein
MEMYLTATKGWVIVVRDAKVRLAENLYNFLRNNVKIKYHKNQGGSAYDPGSSNYRGFDNTKRCSLETTSVYGGQSVSTTYDNDYIPPLFLARLFNRELWDAGVNWNDYRRSHNALSGNWRTNYDTYIRRGLVIYINPLDSQDACGKILVNPKFIGNTTYHKGTFVSSGWDLYWFAQENFFRYDTTTKEEYETLYGEDLSS